MITPYNCTTESRLASNWAFAWRGRMKEASKQRNSIFLTGFKIKDKLLIW
jgi:hypothetical protein